MSTPILVTKLFVPLPRMKVVPRPRLTERLNEALQGKLTLVSAPAGFGKTTLVSAWVSHFRLPILGFGLDAPAAQSIQNPKSKLQNRAVAWLSLDEGDNDPTHFLTYFVAALQTIAPQLGEEVLDLLQSPQPPPIESMLADLLNEITTISDAFVLVLDDYHVIDAQAVDQALTFLLEHLPPQLHLVITTREDPLLPLARLRARGELTELRAADLRFTPDEATTFLNQVMGLDLTAEEVAALESRTEGWIAGLQLAALSMQGRADVSGFIRAFAGDNRYIVDYLVEEVLQRQPEQVRSFLLQTSILERLSGPLCDAVTDQAAGNMLLGTLERGNLFVLPLDDQRHWYRYHHLFADVLYAHLIDEQPERVPILHRRASEWYEQNGLRADAVRHALAAKDFERAAGLVELAWPAMERRFQSATWLGWARALPDEVVRARPVLSVAYAWALLNGGDLEAAEKRLQNAERWLDPTVERSPRLSPEDLRPATAPKGGDPLGAVIIDQKQFRTLPASIATARAYRAQALGDVPGTMQYARRALDLLPVEEHLQRGIVAALLGLAYWTSGELEAAHDTLAGGMANMRIGGNLLFALRGTYGLADIRLAQGRLREAIRIYEQSLQLAAEQGNSVLRGTADLHLGLSQLYLEQDDAKAATEYLLRSKELGKQDASPHWQYRLCLAQARIKKAEGDLDGALDLLDEAERLYVRTPVPDVSPIGALRARVWVAQGRLAEARDWVRTQGLSVEDDLSYLREFEHITLTRVLIAEHKNESADHAILEAIGFLERLLQAAEEGGRRGSAIEILLLQALAYEAQSDISRALASLERALLLAEPEGYIRLFVDEGPPMAHLVAEAVAQGIMPDYTGKLLAAFAAGEQKHNGLDSLSIAPADQPLIEPLSQRELEVLRLIAQGLSNREISERLFLALSSVKGHNRNIFGKLQVKRRTEAVARARELGLL